MRNEHSRMIGSRFCDDLAQGILMDFVKLVKSYKEVNAETGTAERVLFMAFRNSYINVYYRSHSLYKIEEQSEGYKVSFNFNHARFTKDFENKLNALQAYGFHLPQRTSTTDGERWISSGGVLLAQQKDNTISNPLSIRLERDAGQTDFLENLFDCTQIFIGLIQDFFDAKKTMDYFPIEASKLGCTKPIPVKSNKKYPLEKVRQQQIALANQSCNGGYFVYDIEYTQPRSSSQEKSAGRFDILAVKTDHKGVVTELCLMEVKSRKSSLTGKSGVESHMDDMKKYIANKESVETRVMDAQNILACFERIGIMDAHINMDCVHSLPVVYGFVFTDETLSCQVPENIKSVKLCSPWIM